MSDVVIIGGGASGLVAALTAASENNRVTLIERQARVGRKLLASGNGRCNLTNTNPPEGHYHGEGAALACEIIRGFDELSFFRSLGLIPSEQYGGRVYPLSDSANSVLDVLRFALEAKGVELVTGATIKTAGKTGDAFSIVTENRVFLADRLIVACGGKAGGKLGGVSDGYDILKSFGHRCSKIYPALVPVYTEGDYTRSLKGVRAEASVRLGGDSSRGELQFTERGVSGPAVFDLSRKASTEGGELEIGFLPDGEDILPLLTARRDEMPELECGSILAGILHSRLSLALVKYSGLRPSESIGSLTDKKLAEIAYNCSHFRLKIKSTAGFDDAQVTAGGTSTKDFNPDTLESLLVPGLYACGEVLDVDGDCGGYNLRWAWASGHLAGQLK